MVMNRSAMIRLALRMSLGLVFSFAGAVKLRALEQTRESFEHFGMSGVVARPLSICIPIFEVIVGVGMFSRRLWIPFSIISSLLLGLFSTAIVQRIAVGKESSCPCFGQHFDSMTGTASLRRNLVLSLAGSYLGAHAGGKLAWLSGGYATAVAVTGELLQKAQAEKTPRPLLPGVAVPNVTVRDAKQASVSLPSLMNTRGLTALIFVQPGCRPCQVLLDQLSSAGTTSDHDGKKFLLIAPRLDDPSVSNWLAQHTWATLVLEDEQSVGSVFGVYATPTLTIIDRNGKILHPRASGLPEINKVLESTLLV